MKFSFIVPVYNCESTLARCVNSILSQEGDLEVILIDDGSRDNSLELCREFAARDARVVVLSQKNSGPSAARNAGIAVARGEYLAFVDSDDYIAPAYTQTLSEAITTTAADMVFFGFTFVRSGKEVGQVTLPDGCYSRESLAELLPTLIRGNLFGYQWCKVIRRALVCEKELRQAEDVSLHEDLLFTCDCCRYVDCVAVLSAPLYYYVQSPDGLCAKFRPDMPALMDRVNEHLFAFYRDLGLEEVLILERAVFTYYLVLKNDRDQRWRELKKRKEQLKAFFCGPTSRALRENMRQYRRRRWGKKKWVYYALFKTKSLWLYYLVTRIY